MTINYGLRWDMIMPWYEQNNQTGTLIPGEQSVVFPGAPTGYVFPGDPGVPNTITPSRYNNFSPRVGLAYSPSWSDGLLSKVAGGPGKLDFNHDPRNGQPYFNTALFCLPGAPGCAAPLGTIGNAPRRFFYGPGMQNWDMALLKTTKLTETKSLEFRF